MSTLDKHHINMHAEGLPQNSPYTRILYSEVEKIRQAYQLERTYAYSYFLENPMGREVLAQWITSSGRLNIKAYYFSHKDKVIGYGFDVDKDERLTMALMAMEGDNVVL